MALKSGPSRSLYLRTLLHARRCWPHLAGIAALSLLSMPLTLLYPLSLKIAVDSVLGQQPDGEECDRNPEMTGVEQETEESRPHAKHAAASG